MANDDARKRLWALLDRLDGIRALGTIEQTAEWDNDAAQFLADQGRALLAESTKPVDAEFQRNFRDPPDPLAESVPAREPVAWRYKVHHPGGWTEWRYSERARQVEPPAVTHPYIARVEPLYAAPDNGHDRSGK